MITFPAHKSLAAALSLVLIGGCVAPTTVEEANRQDTAIATTVGALAGALIGAKVAANKDGNRASAAATGAAIGALAGYASGRLIEGVRNDYNQAYTQINQTISETDTRIASMQRDSALAERHIAERRSTMEDIDDAEDVYSALQYARSYADSVYAEMNQTFKGLEKQVSVLSGLTGRKAILHVSDGLPRTVGEDIFIFVDEKFRRTNARLEAATYNMSTRYRDLVNRANSGDVTFYTLEATGLGSHQSISADFGGTADGGSLPDKHQRAVGAHNSHAV